MKSSDMVDQGFGQILLRGLYVVCNGQFEHAWGIEGSRFVCGARRPNTRARFVIQMGQCGASFSTCLYMDVTARRCAQPSLLPKPLRSFVPFPLLKS